VVFRIFSSRTAIFRTKSTITPKGISVIVHLDTFINATVAGHYL